LGAAAAGGGEVVPLAVHLGAEDAEEGRTEISGSRAGEADDFVSGDPVEIAPDLASVDFGGTIGRRELAEGVKAGKEDGEVGFVSVGGVVEIEDFGFGGLQDGEEVGG